LSKVGSPWVFQEVIFGQGEAVQPGMYTHNGFVTEFRFGDDVGGAFQQRNIAQLGGGGGGSGGVPQSGWLPSSLSVPFLDNHDTQRGGAPLTYKAGDLYRIANYFMLAHPFGYPKIMSSYYFSDHDQVRN